MSINKPLDPGQETVSLCQHHPWEELIYSCSDCDGCMACPECVTSTHQGHNLIKLINTPDFIWKKLIQHYIEKAEKFEIPKILKELQFSEEKLEQNRKHYQELIGVVQRRGEELKAEIDKITLRHVSTITEVAKENTVYIDYYRGELNTLHTEIIYALRKCHQANDTEDFSIVLDSEKIIRAGLKLPRVPITQTTKYKLGSSPLPLLEAAFGNVEVVGYRPKQLSPLAPQAVKKVDKPVPSPVTALYSLLSEFRNLTDITSLVPTEGVYTWVSNEEKKEVVLLDRAGDVKQSTSLGLHVRDICTSPVTNNLWCCSEYDYSVREMTNPTKTVVRLNFPFVPRALALTHDEDVVVGTFRKVCVYNLEGDELFTASLDKLGRRIIASPQHISVCPTSGNIAVVDWDEQSHEGKGSPCVTVLTSDLQLLFQYRGPTTATKPRRSGKPRAASASAGRNKKVPPSTFWPSDACYDAAGQLFIAERTTKSVQMVSNDGQFMRNLYTDQEFGPKTIGVQTGGVLWIGFDFGIVKVIKYKQ
ncbi:uncharacterized protein LOC110457177 [Mizuhopecten yessoensis]|uniref:uncharacterized protein LOC110457177 n=1 Tax=Mizuhopecten yessoensis TaxID=6573 RepID=UPI000B45DAF3|nr:uncharacterized protein LOC110457177 [Mizuhopecten yessoensis]